MSRPGLARSAVNRITHALVVAEVRRLRDGYLPRQSAADWSEDVRIDDDGLGLDSLEQLGVLGTLAETFGLDDTLLGDGPPQTVGDWIDWVMAGQESGGGTLTVRTSGSTGVPRPCVHAIAALQDETAFFANRFADRKRVVATVPADHLYGLIWTALLPSALEVPLVVRSAGSAVGLAAGDLVVAVPDQWEAMARLTPRFPENVVGISSAGNLDDVVANKLLGAGLAQLVDVYGSSETGAIALRDAPAMMYELLPRWNLTPHGDHGCRLVNETGAATELPDLIERVGDRLLRPIGRRDGAVQVAGLNVWPDHVASVLRSADGVADVAIRLHANGRLKAFVVPDPGQDLAELLLSLEQYVVVALRNHERPKSFRFGPGIPRNAMGKLTDWS